MKLADMLAHGVDREAGWPGRSPRRGARLWRVRGTGCPSPEPEARDRGTEYNKQLPAGGLPCLQRRLNSVRPQTSSAAFRSIQSACLPPTPLRSSQTLSFQFASSKPNPSPMDHSLGAVDLSAICYQDRPILSPIRFEQLDREDFADGIIIQPDPSNFQFPAAAHAPKLNPFMDLSFSLEPFDLEQYDVQDLLGDQEEDDDDDSMEIAHQEEDVPLQVNGHQGPHPAGGVVAVGPPTDDDIGMGKAPGELGVNSLETDATGLIKQPEPCSGDTIDLSTATDREIIDHFRASVEHRKDKEEVPEFDDDLVHLEPWNLPVNKRYYRATNMVSSDEKTFEGGCWKEEEFMGGIRSLSPYGGKKMPFIGLRRTLDFYKQDGTKTTWRMIECISLRVSDGHMFLEDDYGVSRHVYQHLTNEFFNPNTSRISGEGEEDNQNRGCTCTLHSDCLHQHPTVQNNQTVPSPSGKRPRTNDDPKKTKLNVWQHFTRIYIRVPKETGSKNKNQKDGKKLAYAVCNYCDKVFKANSKQGTSHHSRHAESCLRKHSQPSSSKSCYKDIPGGRRNLEEVGCSTFEQFG